MTTWFAGLGMGLSLIMAIGAQNAFVLRQGLVRRHVLPVVLFCAVSDGALIALGVAGMGRAGLHLPWLFDAMRWGGALFLLAYGAFAFRRAWRGGAALMPGEGQAATLGRSLATVAALTWLNPHVWLDTVVLLGSISMQYPQPWLFGAGAICGSFLFFFTLGYGARLLAPLFRRPVAWRWLELGVGSVMWAIAARLIIGS